MGLYRDGGMEWEMGNGKKLGCFLLKQVALGVFGDDFLIAEFAGAAQGLSGTGGVGALAGVMDEQDCELELALQVAQKGEQSGNL